jgi:hypothetical protein
VRSTSCFRTRFCRLRRVKKAIEGGAPSRRRIPSQIP